MSISQSEKYTESAVLYFTDCIRTFIDALPSAKNLKYEWLVKLRSAVLRFP